MKFWDASSIIPLLVAEPVRSTATTSSGASRDGVTRSTKTMQALAADDPVMLVWWATEVECASAIARLERDGALDDTAVTQAFELLRRLAAAWHEVDPNDAVREAAVRLLRVHPLRAADARPLAAAFVAAERRPASLEVITLDDRLAAAARKEGFSLVQRSERLDIKHFQGERENLASSVKIFRLRRCSADRNRPAVDKRPRMRA